MTPPLQSAEYRQEGVQTEDTYLAQVGDGQARLEETIERGRAYLQAGADSLFVPAVIDQASIQRLVHDIPGPLSLNLLAMAPSAPELFQMGVTRVSLGSRAMRTTMGLVRKIAEDLCSQGTTEAMNHEVYSYAEAQVLFASGEQRSR